MSSSSSTYFSWPRWLTCALLVNLVSIAASSQHKVQVAEKVIERNIPAEKTATLRLVAEKATIRLREWDESFIQLKLVFGSMHKQQEVAERELTYMKYLVHQEEGQITLSNTFIFPPNIETLQGRVMVTYELAIPRQMSLEITARYCKVYLSSISGKARINSDYGNLEVLQPTGPIKIKGNATDFVLELGNTTNSIQAETRYGDVQLITPENPTMTFDLSTTVKSIELPAALRKQGTYEIFTFKSPKKNNSPLIRVSGILTTIKVSSPHED